jgi:hypothetical protein
VVSGSTRAIMGPLTIGGGPATSPRRTRRYRPAP